MSTLCKQHVLLLFCMLQLMCLICQICDAKKSDSSSLIETFIDAKDLKKMLRTKNNVFILFMKSAKECSSISKLILEVAEQMKGQATIASIDCNSDGKKLCKKLKVTPEPFSLKHYKTGEFHKDYDRKLTLQSMVNFLRDPTGDMPWEEDENAKNVVHVTDANSLGKLLHKEKVPVMVMFYAPWCGFCKRMKPEYEAAASELKGQSILAAMDVNKPENAVVRKHFNISGFPTILYFESGEMKIKYDGENNKDALVSFMKNPEQQPEKPKEEEWSETQSDVVHLTDEAFDSQLKENPSALVMFYAPWCGHCKKMKPEYVSAAANMKAKNIPGILAALDATKEKAVADRYKISGYPTVKYFKDGQFLFDVNFRNADAIEEFMKDPKEPPPPPPPELPWSDIPSNVVHLTEDDFKPFLKRKKHVIVMFYAPWCGHCKKAKPEFQNAADYFKDDPKVEFAAVDCTVHAGACGVHNVKGYPTLKYFSYYKTEKDYSGGRTESDFVDYMTAMADGKPLPTAQPASPEPQQWWSEIPNGGDVKLLTESNFDSSISQHESALVMFYAPWCGHCKNMKPAFAEAAAKVKELNMNAIFAAVDATIESSLTTKYNVQGFPTLKYFRNGKFIADYQRPRTVTDLISFVKSPPSSKEEL